MGTSNYTIGMCELYFGTGAWDAASLGTIKAFGNITAGEIAPAMTYLDHFTSVKGDRKKDKTAAINKSISIPFTFDEINEENLTNFLYGLNIATKKDTIMTTVAPIEGRAILRFKTDVGTSFSYTIPKCVLKAEGGLSFNAEDWLIGKFTLEVLKSAYTIPNRVSSAEYGYVDFDMTASMTLADGETPWTRVAGCTSTMVNTGTSALKVSGTWSAKFRVATQWKYTSASGLKGKNCIGYKTIAATPVNEYSFLEVTVRASRDVSASLFYFGLEKTATPLGAPLISMPVTAFSANTWNTLTIPLTDRNAASENKIRSVAVYGTSALACTTPASVQAIWIDNVRSIK